MERFTPLPDETILIEEPIHWKNYLLPGALFCMTLLLLVLRLRYRQMIVLNFALNRCVIPDRLSGAVFMLEVFLLAGMTLSLYVRMMQISRIRYYVTDRRIVAHSGILTANCQEMMISRCEMVYLQQSPYERLFGCGDILCVSAGARMYLDDVHAALKVKQTILELITAREPQTNTKDKRHE